VAERPRLLLVPSLSELEWGIAPALEEWADVATYDGPGVGDEPPAQGLRPPATAERGLAEIDKRGWDSCVVVGDEFGSLAAILLAKRRPGAVAGLAIGHPTVSFTRSGDRPAINAAVADALAQLAEVDFRSFIRQDFRSWEGLRDALAAAPGPDREAERYLERVSHTTAVGFYRELLANEDELASLVRPALSALRMPLLLVQHEDCLMFTREGFEDAVAALPGAETASTRAKPSVDPAFSDILREFAAGLPG
jgi:pimeloyl-ACP methyl ester carboxylesterase